jgi:hypothetical protein
MKVYLASRYGRHPEMQEVAASLAEYGWQVTSRWIKGDHDLSDSLEEGERFAIEDFEDITKSDVVINFTEDKNVKGRNRGGRHVEFGIGLALNLRIIVIGPRENVFHYLPTIEQYDDFETFLDQLESEVADA